MRPMRELPRAQHQPSQKGAVKRAKVLAVAEQAALAGNQFLGLLENSQIVTSITQKAFESARKRVAEKLSPAWLGIFTANFDQAAGIDDDHGVSLLKELRTIDAKIQGCANFVDMLSADSQTVKGGSSLRLAASEARAAGVNLSSAVDEIALVREMKGFLANAAYSSYRELLSPSAAVAGGILVLPKLEQESFQVKAISRDLCNLMRPEGQLGMARDFLEEMVGVDHFNQQFKSDLQRFLVLFDPERHDLEHIQRVKTEIETSPAHRFHKLLTLFPTGCEVAEACAKYEQAVLADRGYALELETLAETVDDLDDMGVAQLQAATDAIGVASPPGVTKKYRDVREGLAKITASCSARFRAQHEADLERCQAKVDTMKDALLTWARAAMSEKLGQVLKAIVSLSAEPSKQIAEKTAQATLSSLRATLASAIDEGFKSAEYLGLAIWMPEAEVEKYTAHATSIKNAMNLVTGSLHTYLGGYTQGLPFDIEDAHYVAWLELVGQARITEGSPSRQVQNAVPRCVSLACENCL